MGTLIPFVKSQWFDNAGNPLAGGFITTYEAGKTDKKATYTDYTMGTENDNPVELDSAGRAEIWLGDGDYNIKCEDSEGNELWTVEHVKGSSSAGTYVATIAALEAITQYDDGQGVSVLGYTAAGDGGGGLFVFDADSTATADGGMVIIPDDAPLTGRWIRQVEDYIDPKWYGAVADGSNDDRSAILDANGYAYDNGYRVKLTHGDYYSVDAIELTATLEICPGATLQTDNGAEISGKFINTDTVQKFKGDGIPVLNARSCDFVHVDWFVPTDNNGNVTTYINKAINSAQNVHEVVFGDRTYNVTSLTFISSVKYRGGQGTLIQSYTDTENTPVITMSGEPSPTNITIENLTINGNGNEGSTGIDFPGVGFGEGDIQCNYIYLKNVTVYGCDGNGIDMKYTTRSTFENVTVHSCGANGFYLTHNLLNTFINCTAYSCNRGMYVNSSEQLNIDIYAYENRVVLGDGNIDGLLLSDVTTSYIKARCISNTTGGVEIEDTTYCTMNVICDGVVGNANLSQIYGLIISTGCEHLNIDMISTNQSTANYLMDNTDFDNSRFNVNGKETFATGSDSRPTFSDGYKVDNGISFETTDAYGSEYLEISNNGTQTNSFAINPHVGVIRHQAVSDSAYKYKLDIATTSGVIYESFAPDTTAENYCRESVETSTDAAAKKVDFVNCASSDVKIDLFESTVANSKETNIHSDVNIKSASLSVNYTTTTDNALIGNPNQNNQTSLTIRGKTPINIYNVNDGNHKTCGVVEFGVGEVVKTVTTTMVTANSIIMLTPLFTDLGKFDNRYAAFVYDIQPGASFKMYGWAESKMFWFIINCMGDDNL